MGSGLFHYRISILSKRFNIRYSSTNSFINSQLIPAPHSGNIQVLALNNPKSRNAISQALLTDLKHRIDNILDEGPHGLTRALIITSAVDEAFCAGADLKERKTFTKEQ
jgi:methylglutaconyl-CoA hydratase